MCSVIAVYPSEAYVYPDSTVASDIPTSWGKQTLRKDPAIVPIPGSHAL